MKTTSVNATDFEKKWVVVDAADQTLGRLATEIAHVLRGKHKPSFVPYQDCGDNVVVVNAEKVKLTGQKWDNKVYHHHTGYIGGIKGIRAQDLKEKAPERLLTFAVKGMLPKTKLGRKVLNNLRVYAGTEHPHTGQEPVQMAPRTKGE